LRPALVLLCAHLGDYQFERVAPAAIAVELTHAATLVHDDVIDRSGTRRGRPTAAATVGPEAAILVGDHYFARAYLESSRTGLAEVVSELAAAVMRVCAAELEQQAALRDYHPSTESYMARIEGKTAALLAACCRIGGLLGGLESPDREALGRYGLGLGLAFQIADDVLDCAGTTIETGKIAGTDLRDGTPTLPLLLAAQQDEVVRAALAGDHAALTEGGALVRVAATGALEQSRDVALDYARQARACLNGELHRDELESLTHAVVNRER
jgi:geranylgeranyl pyrophosphate synthase